MSKNKRLAYLGIVFLVVITYGGAISGEFTFLMTAKVLYLNSVGLLVVNTYLIPKIGLQKSQIIFITYFLIILYLFYCINKYLSKWYFLRFQ